MVIPSFPGAKGKGKPGDGSSKKEKVEMNRDKNYWLESRRRRELLRMAPKIERDLGISQVKFLSQNRNKQDEIMELYRRSVKV